MKIDIIQDGQRKELELKGLKGRDIDKLIEDLISLQSVPEEQQAQAFLTHRKLEKEYACQVSGLTEEQLDDLDSDDRDKILGYINTKVQNSMGFLKPSQQ